jgi:hypothetical protein
MPRTRSQSHDPLEPDEEEVAVPEQLSGVPPWAVGLVTAVLLLIVAVVLANVIGGDLQLGPEPEITIGFGRGDEPAPAAGVAGAEAGTVLAGGDPLLPLPPAGLGPYQGREVVGTAVPVLSVVANEGFWVGRDQIDRLYVVIGTGPESPPDVEAGQLVSFTGRLETVPSELPAPFALSAAEGADRLAELGYYVAVPAVEIVGVR